MKTLINAVIEENILEQFGSSEDFDAFYRACGASGVEYIRGGSDPRGIIKPYAAVGCHLIFYSDWVDFWNGNEAALIRKYSTREIVESFYRARDREGLIRQFKEDFDFAEKMGVEYAVFHVSDVSIDEGYSYVWEHTDKEVIDASAELLNTITQSGNYTFKLLLENLWWKGFSMTDPALTRYMLDKIQYENKGIMLDTGHLMNTNTDIRNQEEACRYIHKILDVHGEFCRYIYGVHLHQSVSGAYVREAIKKTPPNNPDFYGSFSDAYSHILKIDTHQPFTAMGVRELIQRINPLYLIYEISAPDIAEKIRLCKIQESALYDSE